MNLANKLTMLRVVLVAPFVALLLMPGIPHHMLWALLVFSVASLTDFVDGYLARKRNEITDFGKFMDPLADKALVSAALIGLVALDLAPPVAVILVMFREFMVSAIRLVAAGGGKVIAASVWGKLKTVTQLVSIIAILMAQEMLLLGWITSPEVWRAVGDGLIWLGTLFTLVSGWQYVAGNWEFISQRK